MSQPRVLACLLVLGLACLIYQVKSQDDCMSDDRDFCTGRTDLGTRDQTVEARCLQVLNLTMCFRSFSCKFSVQEITAPLNINCDVTFLPGTERRELNYPDTIFDTLLTIFTRHGCPDVPRNCTSSFDFGGASPFCSVLIESARCMFEECPAIRGTGDDRTAAGYLSLYTGRVFACAYSVDEMLANGGDGVGRSSVWEPLSVMLLTAMVIKKFLL